MYVKTKTHLIDTLAVGAFNGQPPYWSVLIEENQGPYEDNHVAIRGDDLETLLRQLGWEVKQPPLP